MDNILQKELNKLNDVQNLYSNVLNSININNENICDHIINIRHYIELLEEKIDDLNNYAILKDVPVCNEQIERNKLINNSNNLFKQFLMYSYFNCNI
jgi:hypothetical protein